MSISLINKERFIPSRLSNLSIWLDGADPSTIIQEGGYVTQWKDKSQNENNFVTGIFPVPTIVLNFITPLPANILIDNTIYTGQQVSYTTSSVFSSTVSVVVKGAGGGGGAGYSGAGVGGSASYTFNNVPPNTTIVYRVGRAGTTGFDGNPGGGGEESSVTIGGLKITGGGGGGGGASASAAAEVPGGNGIGEFGGAGGPGGNNLGYLNTPRRGYPGGGGANQTVTGLAVVTGGGASGNGSIMVTITYFGAYTIPSIEGYSSTVSVVVKGAGGGGGAGYSSAGTGGSASYTFNNVSPNTIIYYTVGKAGTTGFDGVPGGGGEESILTIGSLKITGGGGGGGGGQETAGQPGGLPGGNGIGGFGGAGGPSGITLGYLDTPRRGYPGGGGASQTVTGLAVVTGGGASESSNGSIMVTIVANVPSQSVVYENPGVFFPVRNYALSSKLPSFAQSKTMIAVYRCSNSACSMNIGVGAPPPTSVNPPLFGICQTGGNTLYSPYLTLPGNLTFTPTNYTAINYAFASYDASKCTVTGMSGFNNISLKAVTLDNTITDDRIVIGITTGVYTSSNFTLYELIATSNALSSSDRQEVESYLSAKWGLSAQLPSSHPYKNFQPSGDEWFPPNLPTTISGLALWLDTAESATITSNIAGGVTGWADRSGNGCNATAGGSFYPSFSPGGGILFNGTNNFFTTNLTVNSTTHTLIAVHSPASVSRNTSLFRFQGIEYIVFPYRQNDNTPPRGYINSGGSTIIFNNSPLVDNSVPGAVNLIIADISPTAQQVYLNGTLQASASSAITSFTSDTLNIGSYIGSGEFYGGTLYELIVYNQYFEQSERQLLEGYLAWKWNILTKLPSGHPFSKESPIGATVSETSALNIPAELPGLITWLDAADRTSVIDNGVVVTQWTDKSASLDKFTPSSSDKAPIYTKTPVSVDPSIPGVYFGGQKSLTGIVNSRVGSTGVGTCFMVATVGTGAQVLTGGYAGGTSTAGNTFGFVSVNSSVIAPFQGTDPQYANVLKNSGTGALTGPTVFFARINATANAGDGSYNFATPANVGTAPTLWQPYTPSSTPWVLGFSGYQNPQDVYIHEFLCFSIYFNDSQRQLVEGYLAWKWGVQSRLPAEHPYKNARPQSA